MEEVITQILLFLTQLKPSPFPKVPWTLAFNWQNPSLSTTIDKLETYFPCWSYRLEAMAPSTYLEIQFLSNPHYSQYVTPVQWVCLATFTNSCPMSGFKNLKISPSVGYKQSKCYFLPFVWDYIEQKQNWWERSWIDTLGLWRVEVIIDSLL